MSVPILDAEHTLPTLMWPTEHRNIYWQHLKKNICILDIDFQEVLVMISSGSRNSSKTEFKSRYCKKPPLPLHVSSCDLMGEFCPHLECHHASEGMTVS